MLGPHIFIPVLETPLEIHRVDSYQQVASHPCHSWIWWKGDGECHLKLWLWSLILNGEVQVHCKCTHWMSGVLLLCKWLAVSLTCLEEQTTMTTRTIDAAGTAWSIMQLRYPLQGDVHQFCQLFWCLKVNFFWCQMTAKHSSEHILYLKSLWKTISDWLICGGG